MISWARPATGSTWQEVPEAIRAVDANPPALVVLDVGLPPDNAGGWTVLAHLRSTAALRSVPVLILTGQDQIHAEEALARGASEFLGNPSRPTSSRRRWRGSSKRIMG